MINYTIKRLLYFLPTLFVISLVTFIISINAPGDPVEAILSSGAGEGQRSDKMAQEKAYNEVRHSLGLDLPVFYCSLGNQTDCDSIHKISNALHRANLERMAFSFGNWKRVSDYYSALKKTDAALSAFQCQDTCSIKNVSSARYLVSELYNQYDSTSIGRAIRELGALLGKSKETKHLVPAWSQLNSSYSLVLTDQKVYRRYLPAFHWYGTSNQYHRWLTRFIKGDFGISYQDKRPVSTLISSSIGWTLALSLASMILSYLIAIPLGVISASEKDSLKDKTITSGLFMLYSLPNFWIATLLVVFFCGGDWFSWFPSPGADWPSASLPFGEWLPKMAIRLILPLICWTYGSLAFISRQMRGGMLTILGQDFIRTARAKGLDEKKVVWNHAFRNSLLPVITLFASVFPLAIAGSFVIEFIFSIPGMGKLSLEAITARNYPVIFTVMMFTAILTLTGNLIADILYAFADPRISFNTKPGK